MAILAGNNFNIKDFAPALWLDAADSNTLYDDVSGGALVAAGGAVARWEDKSGNGRHATQATADNRPLRTVGAQNTRDALRFDGTDDFMIPSNSLSVLRNVGYGAIFAVCRRDMIIADNAVLHFSRNGSSSQVRLGLLTNSPAGDTFRAGARRTDADAFVGVPRAGNANYNTLAAIANYSAGTLALRENGVQTQVSLLSSGLTSNTDSDASEIGKIANNYLNGSIAEIIAFNNPLNDEQVSQIERYLANKWGLGFNPLSLSPALWLDASDSNTLYDSTTGGALVGAGGAVARWEDKSGNARHITQSTLDNRPIRSVSSLGGRDTLFFDGVNDFMSSISLPASQVVHWFGVFIPQSKAAYHNIYDGSPMLWLQTSNRLEMNAAYTIGLNVSPAAYINQSIICSIRSSWAIAPGSRMRVNGTIVAQNPALVGSFNVTRNISMFNRSNSQTFSGNFAEQLWFTTDLSNADVIAIERYLAQKWNIVP